MNRSHLAALLITVFTLAVLGAAAGSLNAAHPTPSHITGDSGTLEPGGSKGAQPDPTSPSTGHASGHYFLPNWQFPSAPTPDTGHPTSTLVRLTIGLLLLFIGASSLLWWLTRDDAPHNTGPTPTPDEHSVESTAYTSPSQPNHVPPDNEVYRTWQRMVTTVDGSNYPQKTPDELARDAISVGLPETAVRRLTNLFQAVRYGGASPTTDREQDARVALSRIKDADHSPDRDDSHATEDHK